MYEADVHGNSVMSGAVDNMIIRFRRIPRRYALWHMPCHVDDQWVNKIGSASPEEIADLR